MKNFLRAVSKSRGRRMHLERWQLERMAEALIIDLKNGEFPAGEPNNKYYPKFAGKNERIDHERYVNWLYSQDFQDTMNAFHEASIMNGIESIG